MLTEDFILEETNLKYNLDFFSNEQCWVNRSASACLYMCRFEKNQYRKQYYSELGICFPQSLDDAIEKRQAEFLAGRYAARQAIANLGLGRNLVSEIPIGRHRSPVWPRGIKGSITHSHSIAICATILDTDQCDGFIGIDIEDYLSCQLASQVSQLICQPEEISLLVGQGIQENIATTLIFSAKESLFKALYPFVGDYFGFECAAVKGISLKEGYLLLDLNRELSSRVVTGTSYKCNFVLETDSLVTAIMPRKYEQG